MPADELRLDAVVGNLRLLFTIRMGLFRFALHWTCKHASHLGFLVLLQDANELDLERAPHSKEPAL